MDADRFDTLARSLIGAAPSRRRVLTGVAGSSLVTLATALGFAPARATHFGCKHVGKRCTDASQCCSSVCKRHTCRAHNVGGCTAAKDLCRAEKDPSCGGSDCFCYRTTGAANFCAVAAGAERVCMVCATDAECATALNTPGAACVKFTNHCNCTNGSPTVCVKPCPA
jgi:hypothetical protein